VLGVECAEELRHPVVVVVVEVEGCRRLLPPDVLDAREVDVEEPHQQHRHVPHGGLHPHKQQTNTTTKQHNQTDLIVNNRRKRVGNK
jgi:hypothetical protein